MILNPQSSTTHNISHEASNVAPVLGDIPNSFVTGPIPHGFGSFMAFPGLPANAPPTVTGLSFSKSFPPAQSQASQPPLLRGSGGGGDIPGFSFGDGIGSGLGSRPDYSLTGDSGGHNDSRDLSSVTSDDDNESTGTQSNFQNALQFLDRVKEGFFLRLFILFFMIQLS